MDLAEYLVGDFEEDESCQSMPRIIRRKQFCGYLLLFCSIGTGFLYLFAEQIYHDSVVEDYEISGFIRPSPEVLALSSPWYNQPTDPKNCDGAFEDKSMRTRQEGHVCALFINQSQSNPFSKSQTNKTCLIVLCHY